MFFEALPKKIYKGKNKQERKKDLTLGNHASVYPASGSRKYYGPDNLLILYNHKKLPIDPRLLILIR